jgi:hypothetical protein
VPLCDMEGDPFLLMMTGGLPSNFMFLMLICISEGHAFVPLPVESCQAIYLFIFPSLRSIQN